MSSPGPRAQRPWIPWIGAIAVGFALRAPGLTAARPYIAYVDEGNFLRPAFDLVRDGGWDPGLYIYPQLPITAVTAAARAIDPFYRLARGRSLRERVRRRVELYDDLEPFGILLIARCIALALALGVIVLTGLLGERLAGRAGGAAAAILAAVVPALALRGSIATVDSYAAFFVVACALLTDHSRTSTHPGRIAAASGFMAGAAFGSKYPAVLVIVSLAATTLLLGVSVSEKLRRLALAALGLGVGIVAAMPVLLTNASGVLGALRFQARMYGMQTSEGLWSQALLLAESNVGYAKAELGFVFVVLALAGLVIGLADRRTAPTVAGWCVFAGACFLLYGRPSYRPFRNLVPLVPLGCVAAAIAFARLRAWMRHPAWIDAVGVAWVARCFRHSAGGPCEGAPRARGPAKGGHGLARREFVAA